MTSWNETFIDGKAFCAVMHAYDDEAIHYDNCAKLAPLECVNKAFDVASNAPFNVPQLIEPKDVVDGGDTKSVILYVAKLRQACIELMEARIAEREAERLAAIAAERAKARALTQEKVDTLESAASGLRKWCKDKEKSFKDPVASGELAGGVDLDDLRKRLGEIKEFRTSQKPPRAQEKQALAGLHAALESRLAGAAADAAASEAEPPSQEYMAKLKAAMEVASPEALQTAWTAMEAAEHAYEAALHLRIETREKEVRFAETDAMEEPLRARTDAILKWIQDKTADLVAARAADKLGETAAASAALREAVLAFHDKEKPPKEAEKGEVQDGLRAVALRRTQEERDPLPEPYTAEVLEKAWADLLAAAALLEDNLSERVAQLQRREAEAATDVLKAESLADGASWLKKVAGESDKFKSKVANKELGSSAGETQALLDAHYSDFVNKRKPEWADEKAAIESKMRQVDKNRSDEGREAVSWEPGTAEMNAAWGALSKDAAAYEQALLEKLGQLKAEESDRLRRAALVDSAVLSLGELLPPMVARAEAVDASAKKASEAAAQAEAELLMWAVEATERLEAKLAALDGKAGGGKRRSAAGNLTHLASSTEAELAEFSTDERPPKDKLHLELRAAVNDAVAAASVQRYAGVGSGVPAAVETLAKVEGAWAKLEKVEEDLRVQIWKLTVYARRCAALWERLRRGTQRVAEWVSLDHVALTEDRSTASSEGEAAQWLSEAQSAHAEATLQKVAVDELSALASTLTSMQPEYAARAKEAMDGVASVPGMVPILASKVERLRLELTRQRRLNQERLVFGAGVAAFQMSLDMAVEVTSFPISSLDTKDVIERLLAVGSQRVEAIDRAPEGATPETVATSERQKQEWQELMPTLRLRAAEAEQAHKAAVAGAPLHIERESAHADFVSWYGRCLSILVIKPETAPPANASGAHVARADLERAVAVAQAQVLEGDAHTRRLDEVARQLDSLGAESEKLTMGEAKADTLTDADHALYSAHVRSLTTQLATNLKAAPSDAPAPVGDVVAALKSLAEGSPGGSLSPSALQGHLAPSHAAFVLRHVQVSGEAVKADEFNPFPLDERAASPRPLPETLFSLKAHGFAVIDHLNRARTDPKAYAASLKAALSGAYDGHAMTPPWGGPRIATQEGEAALTDLLAHLETASPMKALKFSQGVAEASQELAAAFGASTIKSGNELPLPDRLGKHGKYNGAAAEAVVFGVRQPEAVIAQLLLCDGDKTRHNRGFLLNAALGVGGMGLAEHAEHDCVATLTMLQLFAPSLAKDVTVSCLGPPTMQFNQVLDAIPSDEVRAMCTEALSSGKKVELAYSVASGVDITVTGADGSGQKARLDWGKK